MQSPVSYRSNNTHNQPRAQQAPACKALSHTGQTTPTTSQEPSRPQHAKPCLIQVKQHPQPAKSPAGPSMQSPVSSRSNNTHNQPKAQQAPACKALSHTGQTTATTNQEPSRPQHAKPCLIQVKQHPRPDKSPAGPCQAPACK